MKGEELIKLKEELGRTWKNLEELGRVLVFITFMCYKVNKNCL
jgi:hypothetical protein